MRTHPLHSNLHLSDHSLAHEHVNPPLLIELYPVEDGISSPRCPPSVERIPSFTTRELTSPCPLNTMATKRGQKRKSDALLNKNSESPLIQTASIPSTSTLVTKKDLKPGDVLLRVANPQDVAPSQAMINLAQKIAGKLQPQSNQGESRITHAALWTKCMPTHLTSNTEHCSAESWSPEPEIVEATMGHQKKNAVIGSFLGKGEYLVYRSKNANLGDWTAQIAMIWASENTIPYNVNKAIASGLASWTRHDATDFDEKAKKNALNYAEDAFNPKPAWKKEGAFCSKLVLSAYQAAFLNISREENTSSSRPSKSQKTDKNEPILPDSLSLNADITTPLNLHHQLINSDLFDSIGRIIIEDDKDDQHRPLPTPLLEQRPT